MADHLKNMDYITPEGHALLKNKLSALWKTERPYVTQKVKEAAAMGDRSENAEYIYGKRQLREIDRKIRFLSKKLDSLQIIDKLPKDQSKIYFGAWVTVDSTTQARHTYRIVGPDETELNRSYISVDAPLARALIGKQPGDEVSIIKPEEKLPKKEKAIIENQRELHYQIISVNYAGEPTD